MGIAKSFDIFRAYVLAVKTLYKQVIGWFVWNTNLANFDTLDEAKNGLLARLIFMPSDKKGG